MTKAEFKKLYRESRLTMGRLTTETMDRLKNVYNNAADLAADQVRVAVARELSDLTSERWRAIEASLRVGADQIAAAVEEQVPSLVAASNAVHLDINTAYMMDAVEAAGAGARIKRSVIGEIASAVNDDLVRQTVIRQYSDGYTFVERIWSDAVKTLDNGARQFVGLHGDYQYRVKNLIQLGQAQGRSSAQIALDIQDYVSKGREFVLKPGRFGKLEPGTAEYKKRLVRQIDYRALRIARSEQYASLQALAPQQAAINPASSGEFDWILNPLLEHDCICLDYAAASPYAEDEIPGYPHPNCGCSVEPRLRDLDEFTDDLARWADGESVDYIDQWYSDKYIPALTN